MPTGSEATANQATDVENAPAIAAPETWLSIMRSMNVSIVQERLDTISGAATRRTSRPPLGLDHHVWPVFKAGFSSVTVPLAPSGRRRPAGRPRRCGLLERCMHATAMLAKSD